MDEDDLQDVLVWFSSAPIVCHMVPSHSPDVTLVFDHELCAQNIAAPADGRFTGPQGFAPARARPFEQ